MARVRGQRRAASVGAGAARHKQAQAGIQKKPSYKVVLEEVSEQKKLKTLLSFNAEAPAGFTFIPAGDPQLSNRCKQLARDDGSTVYIVSMSDPKHPELSHEVHRVGYHFSSRVVEKACTSLGVTLTGAGRVLQSSFALLNEEVPTRHGKKVKSKTKGKGRASPPKFDLSQSQATIDTQAREAIKDLFPKIPEADLHETVARSFQKGRDLVGTSSDLSLARRAHLAVLAHIRHTHTNYDDILKHVPWGEARKRVEGPTLDILISWRDDIDDDTNVMRDVLREIIIISDDEDEEDQFSKVETIPKSNRELREKSLEVISANSNLHTQRLDLATELSELESGQPIQYVPRLIARNSDRPLDRFREERQGAQRRQRWEEAVSRQRNGAPSSNLYPRAVQLVSRPIYHPSAQNDVEHQSRISQNPIPMPMYHVYEDSRDGSQRHFPQQKFEYWPQHTRSSINEGISSSTVPIRQMRHSSEQRPVTTTLNVEHRQNPPHVVELASDHRNIISEDQDYVRQIPLIRSAERTRLVELQQPKEVTEVQYKPSHQPSNSNDERGRQRYNSERILPSVEIDDDSPRATARVVREEPLQLEPLPYQLGTHGRSQHGPDSRIDPHIRDDPLKSKRPHDDQELYVVEERPRRPPPFEDRGQVIYTPVNNQPRGELLRRPAEEQSFDKAPVIVQYTSRVAPLPPRPREENFHTHRQVHSVPRLMPDGHERSLGSSFEHNQVVPHEIRRASYAQPMQHPVRLPVPHHALGQSSTYPSSSLRNFATAQPPVTRMVRVDGAGGGEFLPPAEKPYREYQLYDERGRLVENEAPLRHDTAMYTPVRR